MSITNQRESATIYQFPSGGRATLRRQAEFLAAERGTQRIAAAALGSSWYHEEAVQVAAEPHRQDRTACGKLHVLS